MFSAKGDTRLPGDFSGFLDFLRIASAFVVFVSHLSYARFGGGEVGAVGPLAHDAVIVFFILSGYLISWTAHRDANPSNYAVNRAARIYTVAIPALALTFVIDSIILRHHPHSLGSYYQIAQPWKYLPIFFTFATDFWFLAENAFSNAPYWSLCYEVWYYVLFGIMFFGRGRFRILATCAVLLLVGPRLWLLFPVWLFGALLQQLGSSRTMPVSTGRLLFVAGIALVLALKLSGLDQYLNDQFNTALHGFPKARLRYSQFVPGDYLFAAGVGLMIFGARFARLGIFGRAKSVLAAMASVSFSLYLTHYPLLIAFNEVWPGKYLLIGAATLLSASLFGFVVERRTGDVRRLLSSGATSARFAVRKLSATRP